MTTQVLGQITERPLQDRILSLAAGLDTATRMGATVDVPEGSRYIRLSDTVAKGITVLLLQAAAGLRDT